jgi:hypothetical protein
LAAISLSGFNATRVLLFVASGVFGKQAFEGGLGMALCGLLFHFLIAFAFTFGYFWVFPHLPFLRRQKIISGLLYGIFAWLLMNLVVLRLANTPPIAFKWSAALRGAAVLMLCIGLPISLIIHRHYTAKDKASEEDSPLPTSDGRGG